MSRSKRERKTNETYYDLLNWVDSQIEFKPLGLSELGLLFYILQSCNKNYGNECFLNLRVVSAKTLSEVRRLPGKLQALAEKGYIDCEELSDKVWRITVKSSAFASEKQDISPNFVPREEKTSQENQDKNINSFIKKDGSPVTLADLRTDGNKISWNDL